MDSCDGQTAASELQPIIVRPNAPLEENDELAAGDGDLEESPSIIVETRVKPNDITDDSKKVIIVEEEEATTQKNGFQHEEIWVQPQTQIAPQVEYSNFQNDYQNSLKSSQALNVDEKFEEATTIQPSTSNKTDATKPLHKQDLFQMPQKEIFGYNRIISRRPTQSVPLIMQNKPYVSQIPSKTMLRPVHLMHPRPFQMKKPYHQRPVYKTQILARPVRMPHPIIEDRPISKSKRPQNIIFMKPQVLDFMLVNKAPQQFLRPSAEEVIAEESKLSQITPTTPTIKHIEISPQQASTEKEPDLVKQKPYAPLLSIKPSPTIYKMPPARNTGFRPESVVIEGGFKPILSKDEIEDRKDDEMAEGPEIENEGEIGVINVDNESDADKSSTVVETFEPIFVPSPLDKFTQQKPVKMRKRANVKKNQVVFIIKQSRSVDSDETLTDDEIAEAAERVDSYYLPPTDKKLKTSQIPLKPLDIDIPPGTVVTYDGKKVSSASLTMKIPERSTAQESRVSKAAELIKSGPQFVPFKGDLPPLDPRFVNTDVPQLKSREGLSRGLDAPSAPTRLSLVRQLEESIERRKKREAHHTPEHTAEQERQARNQTFVNGSSRVRFASSLALLLICFVTLL